LNVFVLFVSISDTHFAGHTSAITLFTLIWSHYSKGEEWRLCLCRNNSNNSNKNAHSRSTLDYYLFCEPDPVKNQNNSEQQSLDQNSLCCLSSFDCFIPTFDRVGDVNSCHLTSLISWLIALMGYVIILITRFRYSIDVLMGFTITLLLFKYYHFFIKTALERSGPVTSFIRWYEELHKINQSTVNNSNDPRTSILSLPVAVPLDEQIMLKQHNDPSDDSNSQFEYHLQINDKSLHQCFNSIEASKINNLTNACH